MKTETATKADVPKAQPTHGDPPWFTRTLIRRAIIGYIVAAVVYGVVVTSPRLE